MPLPLMESNLGFLFKIIKMINCIGAGLMSHEVIIIRELKIPCIIGTKIATKVFKDGDKVEVDANKGIVRKIQ
jgi:rifampicin phosphotransferase